MVVVGGGHPVNYKLKGRIETKREKRAWRDWIAAVKHDKY